MKEIDEYSMWGFLLLCVLWNSQYVIYSHWIFVWKFILDLSTKPRWMKCELWIEVFGPALVLDYAAYFLRAGVGKLRRMCQSQLYVCFYTTQVVKTDLRWISASNSVHWLWPIVLYTLEILWHRFLQLSPILPGTQKCPFLMLKQFWKALCSSKI